MGQPLLRTERWLEMLRFHNRLLNMKPHRWPRIIYEYDIVQKKRTWVHEVDMICQNLHLPRPRARVEYDLGTVNQAILKYSYDMWWREAQKKPKLRSFIAFKDQAEPMNLVHSNLPRYQRSLLAKLSCGILPLEIETGRYSGIPANERFCKVCNLTVVEDEYHFLYSCPLLQLERSAFYSDHIVDLGTFMLNDDAMKTRFLLSKDMIKKTGKYVEEIYRKRRNIIYKVTN